jgi:hypothetical protein
MAGLMRKILLALFVAILLAQPISAYKNMVCLNNCIRAVCYDNPPPFCEILCRMRCVGQCMIPETLQLLPFYIMMFVTISIYSLSLFYMAPAITLYMYYFQMTQLLNKTSSQTTVLPISVGLIFL